MAAQIGRRGQSLRLDRRSGGRRIILNLRRRFTPHPAPLVMNPIACCSNANCIGPPRDRFSKCVRQCAARQSSNAGYSAIVQSHKILFRAIYSCPAHGHAIALYQHRLGEFLRRREGYRYRIAPRAVAEDATLRSHPHKIFYAVFKPAAAIRSRAIFDRLRLPLCETRTAPFQRVKSRSRDRIPNNCLVHNGANVRWSG